MSQIPAKHKKLRRGLIILLAAAALFFIINFLLQTLWAHRRPFFTPDYPKADLTALIRQRTLSDEDYETLLLQTGLARPAASQLLAQGDSGIQRILEAQESFFSASESSCVVLIGGRFTCEDRKTDAAGNTLFSTPLAPLEPGDVLLSFSTHTFGWRHGHAGLVLDPANGVTLEAALLGQPSALMNVNHWQAYSNFMVLRLKDMMPELQAALTEYAADTLSGIPYHLTSGFLGSKAPEPDAPWFGVQCSYLVWYAFQHFGYDVDGDGGRLVSVDDLARSPLFEVVQVYGMDPRSWMPA